MHNTSQKAKQNEKGAESQMNVKNKMPEDKSKKRNNHRSNNECQNGNENESQREIVQRKIKWK